MSAGLAPSRRERRGAALEALGEQIRTAPRRWSLDEPPAARTDAYVTLLLACGFARIGRPERARGLVSAAWTQLGAVISDPAHAYLVAAFEARAEQASAGLPPEAPLPEALDGQLARLDSAARLPIYQLRAISKILDPEPSERLALFTDPAQQELELRGQEITSQVLSLQAIDQPQQAPDLRGREITALLALSDPAARAAMIARLVEDAARVDEVDAFYFLDGCFEAMHALPESDAIPLLVAASPVIDRLPEPWRAVLYAGALGVAGHFGWAELVPDLLDRLCGAVRAMPDYEFGRMLDMSQRALRRLDLRQELAELLAALDDALTGSARTGASDASRHLLERVAVAGGFASLGDTARALPILRWARDVIDKKKWWGRHFPLTRALVQAYAQLPLDRALAGLAELARELGDISLENIDGFATDTHYCTPVLHFVDSLVLGITTAGEPPRPASS